MELQEAPSTKFNHYHAYPAPLKKVIEYISMNYSKPLVLKDLASIVDLIPNYFHAKFTQATGETLHEFITKIRIN